jgi:phosphate uptake regulator
MKRKLVQQGISTLMVSLPSTWVKEQKLKKGDEIAFEEIEKGLLITSDLALKKRETSFTLKGKSESFVRTLITNAYRVGNDRVSISCTSSEQIFQIQKIVANKLIGFDIVKKEGLNIILENISEPASEQFSNILQKLLDNHLSFIDTIDALLTKQAPEEDIETLEERIIRYDNFCKRIIGKKNSSHTIFFYTFLTLLNHAQRELYHLASLLSHKKAYPATHELLLLVRSLFQKISKAYASHSLDMYETIHLAEKELRVQAYHLFEKHKNEAAQLHHVFMAGRHYYQANSPLAALLF